MLGRDETSEAAILLLIMTAVHGLLLKFQWVNPEGGLLCMAVFGGAFFVVWVLSMCLKREVKGE